MSNRWIERSKEIARTFGYLDKLLDIYPISSESGRELPKGAEEELRKAFGEGDSKGLIYTLLKLPKFPLEDPYVPCLRHYPELLDKNPKTLERIAERLFALDINNLLSLVKQPKRPSRQMGTAFKVWLRSLGFPFLKDDEFLTKEDVAFLEGGDRKLREFSIRELKIQGLKRGVDFILRIGKNFILGEAKFITDFGGSQNNQLREALEVASLKGENFSGIAVLDGVVWLGDNPYLREIEQFGGVALSALLLKDFILEERGNKML